MRLLSKNLDFRLVQLPEIRHSLHGEGAGASKRIRMCANVFFFYVQLCSFSISQPINKLYLSTVVIQAEKLMWPSQKKKKYKIALTVSCSLRGLNDCQPVTAKKKRRKGPMVRPHAYLNGGVTHPVQQAQWPFFNTACSLPLFTGTPNANTNAGGNKSCWNA